MRDWFTLPIKGLLQKAQYDFKVIKNTLQLYNKKLIDIIVQVQIGAVSPLLFQQRAREKSKLGAAIDIQRQSREQSACTYYIQKEEKHITKSTLSTMTI